MTIEKLKLIIIFIIALSPFEFALTIGALGSILKWISLLVIVMCLILNQGVIRYSRYLIPLFLYMILIIFSGIITDASNSRTYMQAIGLMILLCFVISGLSWNDQEMRLMEYAYLFALLVHSLLMVIRPSLFPGASRRYTLTLFGQHNDPNNIAGFMVLGLVMAIALLLEKYLSWKERVFLILTAVLSLYSILKVASRGGLIAGILGIIVCILGYLIQNKNTGFLKKIFKLFVFILLAGIVIHVLRKHLDDNLANRLFYDNYLAGNGSNRTIIWKEALNCFKENPFLGIGLGAFSEITNDGVHNQYLLVLCETGIAGLLLFFSVWSYLLIQLIKYRQWVIVSVIVTSCVVMLFLDCYNKKFMWDAMIFAIVALNKSMADMKEPIGVNV